MKVIGALINLDFGRCQVYKLNISKCLTEREQDYYNLYCDGISQKKLLERLGKEFYTTRMVAETFHISEEQAKILLESQLNKKCFKEYLLDEIEKFPVDSVREIRKSAIYIIDDKGNVTDEKRMDNRIVWFENECVRRCNTDLKGVPLLDQFVVLKCSSEALAGVINQIISHGIYIDGKHYIFYTSSTSQMKESEITLFEEEYWKENQYALMCGLTEERINSKKGINMGKYLAAKALNISNSVKMETDISIDDVLVVHDFKTIVTGIVNYLDVNTLDIEEKEKSIEIEHMDGAGVFIPGTLPCSCQIRGGWLKGAVFPFDFHKFIRLYRGKLSDVHMEDAWGESITVDDFLKANVILTDSQFKMRRYYNSMDEYRECFKKAGLSITINNCAHNPNNEVRVAYQPFQTISRENLTDESIKDVTSKTIDYINGAKKDPKIALKLMGIELDDADFENNTEEKVELSPLYAAILKYPQMLNDIHVRKTMKSALLATRKQAQGCKVILDGMWSYICPDLFAFCEWLFLGEDVPEGLVPDGYIYNHYYDNKDIEEICCLRYPHLSDCEHGIRKVLQSKECSEWFEGKDTVVSSHDLISKVLQADWDGDHICNIHDKSFLSLLDKNKYPLIYTMTKAQPTLISNDAIMLCLRSSFFENENIGYVSNSITKIFNSIHEPDIKLVRVLCAYNNFVIDYFKTQKSMDLKEFTKIYNGYKDKSSKCPWFFKYAKDKNSKQCAEYNKNSNCDRISKYIADLTSCGISKIDYSSREDFNPEILKDKDLKIDRQSDEYSKLRILLLKLKNEKSKIYKDIKLDIKTKESDKQIFNIYCIAKIKDIIADRKTASNYLVDIEYYTEENKDSKKDILWNCFGDIIFDNLCNNMESKNGVNIPIKRKIYQFSKDKEKEIMESRKQVKKKQEELKTVPITQPVYDYLMDVKTRANRTNDKYIMFLLYVFIERFKKIHDNFNTDYIRIYHGTKKKGKITCASIDKLIGSQCTKKGLEQLQKKGYIKIEARLEYDKVYLLNVPDDSNSKAIFGVVSVNPLYDLWEKNGDRKIGHCKICGKKFIVTGNAKTCPNEKCSNLLAKINRNKAS